MRALRFVAAFIAVSFVALAANTANATTALQMNLAQMITNADKVFVGTVIDVTEIRVEAGGGELPAITYRFKIDESFKGSYDEIKGVTYTEVSMIGTLEGLKAGQAPIPGFPLLAAGTQYLLVVAPEGPVGLTTTMGLGQGTFSLTGLGENKIAINGANNVGLFAGMDVGFPDGVAIPYNDLAALIRDIVGGAE